MKDSLGTYASRCLGFGAYSCCLSVGIPRCSVSVRFCSLSRRLLSPWLGSRSPSTPLPTIPFLLPVPVYPLSSPHGFPFPPGFLPVLLITGRYTQLLLTHYTNQRRFFFFFFFLFFSFFLSPSSSSLSSPSPSSSPSSSSSSSFDFFIQPLRRWR